MTATADGKARRNARFYLFGLAASLLGNSAMTLAAGIWVKTLTGSSSAAAMVSVCIYLPSVFGPVAGMVADRVRRRPYLITVNLASAMVMLPLLFVQSANQTWLIYAVMLGYGVSLVLIDPAENALFAAMLPDHIRQQVNGVRMALQEGGKFVAPLAGAGLFVAFGGGMVALLDAITFVVAALALLCLRVEEPRPGHTDRRWWAELTAGFGYLRTAPTLRATTIAGAVAMVVAGVATAAQYSLVDALHRPPTFLGVLTGVLGAGSIIAALTSSAVIRRFDERRLAVIGLVNGAVGTLLRCVGTTPAALLGSFVLGFALPWTVVAVVNLVQRSAPIALQGRVTAAIILCLFAPQPLAHAAGAVAIAEFDFRTVYAVTAAVMLVTAVWLQLRPAIRGSRTNNIDGY